MGRMRRATTLAPGRMRVDHAPDPVAGRDEAVLDVRTVGLCGSDYSLFLGTHPYSRFPQTQGHEISGVVRTLPDGYAGPVRLGDLVAVEPLLACGTCIACRRGRANCCAHLQVLGAHLPGGLAERMAAPVQALHPVGELDAGLAAMVEPVSIGLQAVHRGGIRAGDDVLVLGGGPIGLTAVLAASAAGARVIAADRVASRLERATAAGAAATVLSSEVDLMPEVRRLTGGDGPTTVIDATGAASLIRTAVDVVAHAGTVVVVGISREVVEVPVADLTRKELTLTGSRNSVDRFPEAIGMVRAHADAIRSWVTHRVDLAEAPEAIAFAIDHPELVEKMHVRVSG
jgi:L-gulonate 5-dehydrogenase